MTCEASLETFTGDIPRESLTDEELKETLTGEGTLAVEKQSLTVEEQNENLITEQRRETREKLAGEEERREKLAVNILHKLKKNSSYLLSFCNTKCGKP